MIAVAVGYVLSAAGAGAEQLVVNPHFTEWASAKPAGWSVLGDPAVWWTDSRPGAKRTVNMDCGKAGDGLMQRVAVERGRRYFVRAWTGASAGNPGEVVVRDVESNDVLFRRAADRAWLQEHVGFFTAKGREIDLVFRSAKGGSLDIDNVTVAPAEVDPTPSRVAIPKVPVFYSSFDPRWVDALGAINIVSGGTQDVRHLAELRGRGVLLLSRVTVPNRGQEVKDDVDAQAEELLAHWLRPFHDTKEGAVPGGADGIIIDELEAFTNDAPRLAIWETALAELRRLYPRKVIAVWGSGAIAAPAPAGETRSRLMEMLARSTDLFMIEIYQASCERNTEPGWVTGKRSYGRDLSEYAMAAKVIGETCPELLPKTVVCLVTAQNVGMNFDIGAEQNFIKWLKVQMTHVPRLGRDGELGFAGIGQWVSYRARLSTLVAFEQHAREIFLADTTPVALGDDDAGSGVGDPSFEAQEDSPWIFAGPARRAKYGGTELPDLHDKKVEHFQHFAEIGTGARAGSVRQVVRVDGGKCYELSAYALPVSGEATVRVRALDGEEELAGASETMHGPTAWWVRVPVTFRVPPGRERVTIEITTDGSDAGERIAVDFVDLAPMDGLNAPMSVTSIESVKLVDLPARIVIKGRNFLPKDIVRIGRDVYGEVTFVSTEELHVLVPELSAAGEYDITVRHDDWLGQAQAVTVEKGLTIER